MYSAIPTYGLILFDLGIDMQSQYQSMKKPFKSHQIQINEATCDWVNMNRYHK